jgi:hypothetical protein
LSGKLPDEATGKKFENRRVLRAEESPQAADWSVTQIGRDTLEPDG